MNRTLIARVLFFLTAFFCSPSWSPIAPALAQTNEVTLNAEQEAGRKLYLNNCSSCHGPRAEGNGPAAAALKQAPPDLRQIAARHEGEFPEAKIRAQIDGREMPAVHGSREMPIWGRAFSEDVGGGSIGEELSSGSIHLLLQYLKAIQEE